VSSDNHSLHISPMSTYYTVYGLLLVLTVATVGVSYAGLPSGPSLFVAMAVASVKATVVALWFMHLKYDTSFNRMVFASAILFMAVFFGFTLTDLGSRGSVLAVEDNFVLRQDRAEAKMAAAAAAGTPIVPVPRAEHGAPAAAPAGEDAAAPKEDAGH
jgi:cytochrome c oxidase subunit IV